MVSGGGLVDFCSSRETKFDLHISIYIYLSGDIWVEFSVIGLFFFHGMKSNLSLNFKGLTTLESVLLFGLEVFRRYALYI